jgi:HD-like signal output (HDOD) protein
MSQVSSGSVLDIADAVDSIPSLPDATSRIISLVNDDNVDIEDVERSIRMDQSLAVAVLRFANNSSDGSMGEIADLEKAIRMLGLNKIRSIALSYGMDQHYSTPESELFPRDEFWNYSLGTGICSELVAEKAGLSSDRKKQAFSAGHLHAVGKTILDQHFHDEFLDVIKKTRQKDIPMTRAEEEVLGTTHCEIGSSVLKKWNLPDIVYESAEYYIDPEDADDEIVTIVHLASVFTQSKNFGECGDEDLDYLKEREVSQLGLDDDDLRNILHIEFPHRYHKFVEE